MCQYTSCVSCVWYGWQRRCCDLNTRTRPGLVCIKREYELGTLRSTTSRVYLVCSVTRCGVVRPTALLRAAIVRRVYISCGRTYDGLTFEEEFLRRKLDTTSHSRNTVELLFQWVVVVRMWVFGCVDGYIEVTRPDSKRSSTVVHRSHHDVQCEVQHAFVLLK